jgi:hypothetical protein
VRSVGGWERTPPEILSPLQNSVFETHGCLETITKGSAPTRPPTQVSIVLPPPPAAPPPPRPPPDPIHIVDTVVCAAAEAMQIMPDDIRPALRAAFRRARLAGLTTEAVDMALHSGSVSADPGRGVTRGESAARKAK